MTAYCTRKPQPSYFVVMCDYGTVREAIVDPEITRQGVIDRLKSGDEYRGEIAFIHHCADGLVEDVTRELIEAAESDLKADARDRRADRIAAQRDHAHDLRKHEVV